MDQPLAKRSRGESENNDLIYDCNKCDDKFPSKIKLEEHLIRMHKQLITVLSDEVVEHILEFLHPNDLVSLSHTCSTYKHLVPEYFQRKRRCGWVEIIISWIGVPKFATYNKEKYEKVFRSIIRNVKIYVCDKYELAEKLNFIAANCSKNILSLIIDGCGIEINESHMAKIDDQIHGLEFLALNCQLNQNIQWNRFTNLRVLCVNGNQTWLTQKFSNLHTLHLSTHHLESDHLTKFFQNNMQIETISCFDPEIFQAIWSSKINCASLLCLIDRRKEEETVNAMNKCYNQIGLFDVNVRSIFGLHELSRMEKAKRLHCNFCEEIPDWSGYIDINEIDFQLPHIQWLHTMFKSSTQKGFVALVKLFPNLSELWIDFRLPIKATPNQIVSILVDGLPKLQDLYLARINEFEGEIDDLRNWSSSRLSTKNASTVTVHVEDTHKSYFDLVGFETNRVTFKPNKNVQCGWCSRYFESKVDYLKYL